MAATKLDPSNPFEKAAQVLLAERGAWCQGEYHAYRHNGKKRVVSHCAMGALQVAFGAAYVKPGGRPFISKDRRKWLKVADAVNLLAETINREETAALLSTSTTFDSCMRLPGGPVMRPIAGASSVVSGFNDSRNTTRADVVAQLRKAGRIYASA